MRTRVGQIGEEIVPYNRAPVTLTEAPDLPHAQRRENPVANLPKKWYHVVGPNCTSNRYKCLPTVPILYQSPLKMHGIPVVDKVVPFKIRRI
jgi:hypothetical protein